MKLQVAERDVQMIGQHFEKRAAQIELNPIIFEILSGKIYSNKILAVIRELSCNAVDAHKMAKHAKPFDVQLPTLIEPVFRIRDYGVGLSHENVFNLYMTFGASAKRSDDNLIGGLGIGSKAPLAYTNAFTVTSYFNGEQRSYNVFIDDDGKPATSHIDTQNTDQPNGLEISVPVKQGDISVFNLEAENVYKFFNPILPNFVGKRINIRYPEYEIPFDTTLRWGWRKGERAAGWGDTGMCVAVMGNIGYPLVMKDVRTHANWTSELQAMMQSPLNIEFNIGDLDIAASREALSYTPRTQATIIKRLLEIYNLYKTKFQTELDKQPNIWEATKWYNNASTITNVWFSRNSFTFKGKQIQTRIRIEPHVTKVLANPNATPPVLQDYNDYTYIRGVKLGSYHFGCKRVPMNEKNQHVLHWNISEVEPSDVAMIVLYDSSVQSQAKLRTLWDTMTDKSKDILVVHPVTDPKKGAAMGHFLKQINGAPKLVKISSITADAQYLSQGPKVTKATVEVRVVTNFGDGKFPNSVEETSFNLAGLTGQTIIIRSQFAVPFIEKSSSVGTGIVTPNPTRCQLSNQDVGNLLKAAGYTEDKFLVIPVTKFTKKLASNPMLITIEDYLAQQGVLGVLENSLSYLEKKLQISVLANTTSLQERHSTAACIVQRDLLNFNKSFASLVENFKDLSYKVVSEKFFTDGEKSIHKSLTKFFRLYCNWDINDMQAKDLLIKPAHQGSTLKSMGIDLEEGNKFFDKFPMIELLEINYQVDAAFRRKVLDYMKLIDNTI